MLLNPRPLLRSAMDAARLQFHEALESLLPIWSLVLQYSSRSDAMEDMLWRCSLRMLHAVNHGVNKSTLVHTTVQLHSKQ